MQAGPSATQDADRQASDLGKGTSGISNQATFSPDGSRSNVLPVKDGAVSPPTSWPVDKPGATSPGMSSKPATTGEEGVTVDPFTAQLLINLRKELLLQQQRHAADMLRLQHRVQEQQEQIETLKEELRIQKQREALAGTVSSQPQISAPAPSPANSSKITDWESFLRVQIPLGLLVHLKQAFQKADTNKTGSLDIEKLGTWVQEMGMKNITYSQLKSMIEQVDTNRNGMVEWWEFFGMQVFLNNRLSHFDLKQWMLFVTQAPDAVPVGGAHQAMPYSAYAGGMTYAPQPQATYQSADGNTLLSRYGGLGGMSFGSIPPPR